MKAPAFWHQRTVAATLLSPLGCLCYSLNRIYQSFVSAEKMVLPTFCVGNAIAGGAGKTPTALLIAEMLQRAGYTPHFCSRGYGGNLSAHEPVNVDLSKHSAADVGDEPLLLAQQAPCWISRNRPAAAMAAKDAGADVLVLDDGMQNPAFQKDATLLVIDGPYGNGNGYLFPTGPLRQPFRQALQETDGILMIGQDLHGLRTHMPKDKPYWNACLKPHLPPSLHPGQEVIAFAGIGRPQKFYDTVNEAGLHIVASRSFADHHPYEQADVTALEALQAQHGNAPLVTTAKDAVRLPAPFRQKVQIITVSLEVNNQQALQRWLKERLPL